MHRSSNLSTAVFANAAGVKQSSTVLTKWGKVAFTLAVMILWMAMYCLCQRQTDEDKNAVIARRLR